MKLSTVLQSAWNDVEQADRNGHLTNQSMLAFVMTGSLNRTLADCLIVYDGRTGVAQQAPARLVILRIGEIPLVSFIGDLQFGTPPQSQIQHSAIKLSQVICRPEFPLLTHDSAERRYEVRPTRIAPDCEFGLFVVTPHGLGAEYHEARKALPDADQKCFHFGVGVASQNICSASRFTYMNPAC